MGFTDRFNGQKELVGSVLKDKPAKGEAAKAALMECEKVMKEYGIRQFIVTAEGLNDEGEPAMARIVQCTGAWQCEVGDGLVIEALTRSMV